MTLHSIAKARLHKERPLAAANVPAEIWCVIDDTGQPCHFSTWPEATHEHIRDALINGYDDARHWVVRRYVVAQEGGK